MAGGQDEGYSLTLLALPLCMSIGAAALSSRCLRGDDSMTPPASMMLPSSTVTFTVLYLRYKQSKDGAQMAPCICLKAAYGSCFLRQEMRVASDTALAKQGCGDSMREEAHPNRCQAGLVERLELRVELLGCCASRFHCSLPGGPEADRPPRNPSPSRCRWSYRVPGAGILQMAAAH